MAGDEGIFSRQLSEEIDELADDYEDQEDALPLAKRARLNADSGSSTPLADVMRQSASFREQEEDAALFEDIDFSENERPPIRSSPPTRRGGAKVTFAEQDTATIISTLIGDEDATTQDFATDASGDGVLMSIVVKRHRVGCAVFEESSGALHLLEDTELDAPTNVFRSETVILDREARQGDLDASAETQVKDLVALREHLRGQCSSTNADCMLCSRRQSSINTAQIWS